jgi:hypothetical protein
MMRAGILDPRNRFSGAIEARRYFAIKHAHLRTVLKGVCKVMLRIAAASIFLTILLPASEAPADPNYAVWLCAHERMVANWRRAEPRCGWTVGGYTCSKASRHESRAVARARGS